MIPGNHPWSFCGLDFSNKKLLLSLELLIIKNKENRLKYRDLASLILICVFEETLTRGKHKP